MCLDVQGHLALASVHHPEPGAWTQGHKFWGGETRDKETWGAFFPLCLGKPFTVHIRVNTIDDVSTQLVSALLYLFVFTFKI